MTEPIDRHYTTPELATAIVARLVEYGDLQDGDRVCDPCVGKGAFANAILATGKRDLSVVAVDSDPEAHECIVADFLSVDCGTGFQLICGNPPYSLAEEFIRKSIAMLEPRGTAAFLLTLQFLGSISRRPFFAEFPPSTIDVIRPRPSFASNGGTDAREYALFRWTPQDFAGLTNSGARIGFIDWTKPRKRK